LRAGGTLFGIPRTPPDAAQRLIDKAQKSARQGSFAAALQRAVEKVNELQARADREAEAVATGRSNDIHGAIVAMQQAELALELTAQVVQRAIEAYKEISRMQI